MIWILHVYSQTSVATLLNHIIILNEFWKGKLYTYLNLNLTFNFLESLIFDFCWTFLWQKITQNSISPPNMRYKNHEITSMQPYPLKAFQK
jgi:hypothetical protein